MVNMKLFFLIIIHICSTYSFAQVIKSDEYEIYATFLSKQYYKNYSVNLGIPIKYQGTFNFEEDFIAQEIHKLPNKIIDKKKLSEMVLQFATSSGENKFIKSGKVYFSPIFFKTKNEAYFFSVMDYLNRPKEINLFLKARKFRNRWIIEHYYDIF